MQSVTSNPPVFSCQLYVICAVELQQLEMLTSSTDNRILLQWKKSPGPTNPLKREMARKEKSGWLVNQFPQPTQNPHTHWICIKKKFKNCWMGWWRRGLQEQIKKKDNGVRKNGSGNSAPSELEQRGAPSSSTPGSSEIDWKETLKIKWRLKFLVTANNNKRGFAGNWKNESSNLRTETIRLCVEHRS